MVAPGVRASGKLQDPNSKRAAYNHDSSASHRCSPQKQFNTPPSLEFGAWSFSGCWMLEFGIFFTFLTATSNSPCQKPNEPQNYPPPRLTVHCSCKTRTSAG